MKVLVTAGLVAGTAAVVLPREQCCFQLTASGGVSGTVGQLSDGQNRVGGGYSPATYCIKNSAITDSNGRGCILTLPTSQFQCDQGVGPTSGFSISSNGQVEYNSSAKFYACPATDNGEYNVYTTPVEGQKKCVEISLSSNGECSRSGSGSGNYSSSMPAEGSSVSSGSRSTVMPSASSTGYACNPAHSYPNGATCVSSTGGLTLATPITSATSYACNPAHSYPNGAVCTSSGGSLTLVTPTTVPTNQSASSRSTPSSTPTSGSSACQTSLTGAYQTPHLIVPVSSSQPNQSYGTSYNGTINEDTSTIFNFDIPESYSGKTCSVIFLFPKLSQLQTSSYTFSGSGSVSFLELSSSASQHTTWNSVPAVKKDLGTVTIKPGNSYVISSGACEAGQTESIELGSKGGLSLEFFEDWNPASLGLYVTAC